MGGKWKFISRFSHLYNATQENFYAENGIAMYCRSGQLFSKGFCHHVTSTKNKSKKFLQNWAWLYFKAILQTHFFFILGGVKLPQDIFWNKLTFNNTDQSVNDYMN